MGTRIRILVLSVLALISVSGCAVVASPGGNGSIYTSVQGPIAPGTATSGSKTGRACAMNVLGVVATGDASIAEAKRQGGITTVASVDHESLSVLGVYSRFCTVAAGE